MASLLEVDQLKIDARKDDGSLTPIVKGVSFKVERGEVVALIGESGSGKTTIALSALGYTKPGLEFTSGEVRLHGQDVISMPSEEKRLMRGQKVAYLALSLGNRQLFKILCPPNQTDEQANLRVIPQAALIQEDLAILHHGRNRLGESRPHRSLKRLGGSLQDSGKPFVLSQVE